MEAGSRRSFVCGLAGSMMLATAIAGCSAGEIDDATDSQSSSTAAAQGMAATAEATSTTTTEATTTAPPTTSAPAATAAPTTTTAPATPAAPPTTAAPSGYTMPNLVGAVLQDAQDEIQAVTGNPIFFSFSHDLLDDRMQIMDSNWKVCDQNVAPGATFTDTTRIDFGVVKLNESCP